MLRSTARTMLSAVDLSVVDLDGDYAWRAGRAVGTSRAGATVLESPRAGATVLESPRFAEAREAEAANNTRLTPRGALTPSGRNAGGLTPHSKHGALNTDGASPRVSVRHLSRPPPLASAATHAALSLFLSLSVGSPWCADDDGPWQVFTPELLLASRSFARAVKEEVESQLEDLLVCLGQEEQKVSASVLVRWTAPHSVNPSP